MQQNSVRVRLLEERDVPALSVLASLCFDSTFGHLYSKENLERHLKETCSEEFFRGAMKNDIIMVAEQAGTLKGYIKFGANALPVEEATEADREIHRLYIHPQAQRKGYGRLLMKHALHHNELKKARNIYLSVYQQNINAQRFYETYGFHISGECDYYVGTHKDPEFIMKKSITS